MLKQVDAKRKEQLKKLRTDQTKKKAKKQKQYQEAVNITNDEKPQNPNDSPRNEKNNEEYKIEGNKYHKDNFLTEDVGPRKNRDVNINFFFQNSKVRHILVWNLPISSYRQECASCVGFL